MIQDLSILEFAWGDGAYTVTEPGWDSSLWVDDSGGQVVTGFAECDNCATIITDVSYSYGGVACTTIGATTNGMVVPNPQVDNDEELLGSHYPAFFGPPPLGWAADMSSDAFLEFLINANRDRVWWSDAIAFWWTDLTQVGGGDVTSTAITGDTSGVAITYHDAHFRTPSADWDPDEVGEQRGEMDDLCTNEAITVQVQLYDDSKVRILYAFSGMRMLDGTNCGAAMWESNVARNGFWQMNGFVFSDHNGFIAPVPADEAECAMGNPAGSTCQLQCPDGTTAVGPTTTGECTTIEIPGNSIRSGWIGFDFDCHCLVADMPLDGHTVVDDTVTSVRVGPIPLGRTRNANFEIENQNFCKFSGCRGAVPRRLLAA